MADDVEEPTEGDRLNAADTTTPVALTAGELALLEELLETDRKFGPGYVMSDDEWMWRWAYNDAARAKIAAALAVLEPEGPGSGGW